MDDLECSRKLKIDLAFKMLSSARSDLIPHALQLLPSTKVKNNLYNAVALIIGSNVWHEYFIFFSELLDKYR